MVFWKTAQPARVTASAASAGMDHSEELLAEVDEPPDERKQSVNLPPPQATESYLKTRTQQQRFERRESLLTRQLHSETEHSDDEHAPFPPRTLSTQSTWSNQSTASTAELTSDDGRSMPSPAMSPPLPPTEAYNALPINEKLLDRRVQIVGQEDVATAGKEAGAEKSVEATLGRKRCIMFACRGKDEAKSKPTSSPAPAPAPVIEKPAESSPPKRKCMIKFACPTRAAAEKTAEPAATKRPVSPPPPQKRPSGLKVDPVKTHRGSDSTVTHVSPKSIRKSPGIVTTAPTPTTTDTPRPTTTRKLSNDSEGAGTEATRFHEFASSEDEPEEWTKESSCHRSRLTVNDTLQKESVIRKACEEVEEEVLEEEDEEEADEVECLEDEQGDLDDDEDADEDEVDVEEDESDQSDAGFHSDDEDGFADSDDGEDSDYEWWKPGGSTAATSVDHLDRLHAQLKPDAALLASSINSMSSGQHSPKSFKRRPQHRRHGHARSNAIPIGARLQAEDEDLPDSTDFVCGTLDEDRPLEQAYINRMKEIETAKHRARPQDIDPTFPTSDPDMDEEDDEDLVEPEDSEGENMVHGEMEDDEAGGGSTLRRHPSSAPRRRSNMHRSPPPAGRYHSPPPMKRVAKHHSPPPPVKHVTARSPPPRRLFGSSPRRARSPAPGARMTSPPNTRSSSPSAATAFMKTSKVLAERPQLTHTASLPRGAGLLLSRMCKDESDDDGANTVIGTNDVPKRGAIDIVKGLEKKRQRRREKMWQKMCAKAAAKGDKAYKVKPGKGCERMREVGLQLQEYQGKAEHILSL